MTARSPRLRSRGAPLLGLVLLAGCAAVRPRAGFDDVDRLVRDRTGSAAVWAADAAADDVAGDTVQALLAAGLTAERAVRVALLANRELQATYEELGLARADVVQAGLVSNPVVSISRFTRGAVGEFGLALAFVDLLQRPLRRRVSAAAFEAAKLRVADAVYRHTADVRAAYYTLVAAEQAVELRRTTAQSTQASARAARAIHTAGNVADVTLAAEAALAEQTRADLVAAQGEAAVARERLVRHLGVTEPGSVLLVTERLPALADAELTTDSLVALAARSRLDLGAALEDVRAAGRALGLARRFRLLPDGTLTWDAEGDGGAGRQQGPGLAVPIPLFDRGQARTAAAGARLRQAVARHDALAVAVRAEVRAADAQLRAARARADIYRTRIVPLRHRVLAETQLQYNAMSVGVFGLLQAKQAEIEAGHGLVTALRDYWLARVELERAVGTRLPFEPGVAPPLAADPLADVPTDAPASRAVPAVPGHAQPAASGPDSTTPRPSRP